MVVWIFVLDSFWYWCVVKFFYEVSNLLRGLSILGPVYQLVETCFTDIIRYGIFIFFALFSKIFVEFDIFLSLQEIILILLFNLFFHSFLLCLKHLSLFFCLLLCFFCAFGVLLLEHSTQNKRICWNLDWNRKWFPVFGKNFTQLIDHL